MTPQVTPFDSTLTVFFLVKTAPEWLGFPFEARLNHARTTFQPILDEFQGRVQLSGTTSNSTLPRSRMSG